MRCRAGVSPALGIRRTEARRSRLRSDYTSLRPWL